MGRRGRPAVPEGARPAVSRPKYRDLKRNLIQFARLLRANDMLVGPGETADVMRAVEKVDIGDRDDVRLSNGSIATSKPEDFPIYDALFEYFWGRTMEMEDVQAPDGGPKLVLICDVSRSMDSYSRFLLQFIYALQNVIGRVESFAFSSSLHRVSNYFKSSDIHDALERVAREVPDWSGGTRIGYSLSQFLEKFPDVLDHRTVLIVLSDGLDTGAPELLEKAMEELQSRSARVIWLNPLLGSSDSRPLA